MGFVRIKKINGVEYAYIVENQWRKRKVHGSRQKVKGYLGRVYRFPAVSSGEFYTQFDGAEEFREWLEGSGVAKIVFRVVKWELGNHGFVGEGNKMVKGECVVDFSKKEVYNSRGGKAAVAMHDGFFSGKGFRKMLRFDDSGDEEEVGYKLAKLFIENGIKIPKEVFVVLFRKMFE